jgi:hypothetical protein
MADDSIRLSEFLRAQSTEDELHLQASEETGRGKRFGTTGEIALNPDEAERLAKWVLARNLDA